jgi:hypothetical protein
MKKGIIYSLLIAVFFLSCRKSDNPKLPALERVPVPSLSLDPSSDVMISPADPESFNGKVIVDLFFKDDIPPKKFDVVIIKNNEPSSVKVLQSNVTTFPTTVDITGAELAELFGGAIEDGDLYTVGVDVTTQDGNVYQAFPSTGVAYGTGVPNEAGGVKTTIEFLKPCTFVSEEYDGDFSVVSDEWADYAAGDVITVSRIDDTHISFEYLTDPASPIILTIDPSTNKISVPRQSYGKYGGTELFCETVGDGSSVNPCDLSLSVTLQHTNTSGGSYGIYTIKLKKK